MRKSEWKQVAFPVLRLRELLSYCPDSGVLTWKPRDGAKQFNSLFANKPAGSECSGYLYVRVSNPKAVFLAHRIAWAIFYGHWPDGDVDVDHCDGDRLNNRISNLRLATPAQNCRNKRTPLGAVPFKGVTFVDWMGRYRARIVGDSGRLDLGLFETPELAAVAYDAAAISLHGEFAVTNLSLGLLETEHA